jgi:hypothetical protein
MPALKAWQYQESSFREGGYIRFSNGRYGGERRSFPLDFPEESRKIRPGPLGLQKHATRDIAHPPTDAMPPGQPEDKRAEPDTLDNSFYLYPQPDD